MSASGTVGDADMRMTGSHMSGWGRLARVAWVMARSGQRSDSAVAFSCPLWGWEVSGSQRSETRLVVVVLWEALTWKACTSNSDALRRFTTDDTFGKLYILSKREVNTRDGRDV